MIGLMEPPPFDGEQAKVFIRLGLNRIRLQKKKKVEMNEGMYLIQVIHTIKDRREKLPDFCKSPRESKHESKQWV
jgi:hypothetical protein